MRANHSIKFLLIVPLLVGIHVSRSPAAEARPDATELFSRFAARTKGPVSRLESVRQSMSVSTRMAGRSVTMDQRVEMVFPDRIRRTMLMAENEQAIVINAGKGFLASGELSLPLPEGRLSEAIKQLGRDLLVLAASTGSPELRVTGDGTQERDGTACRIVEVSLGPAVSRLCLDSEGKAIVQSFEGRHPMSNAPGTIEISFSDYRETNGVFYPYRHVISFNGEEMVSVTIQSLEINPDLPDSLFETSSTE